MQTPFILVRPQDGHFSGELGILDRVVFSGILTVKSPSLTANGTSSKLELKALTTRFMMIFPVFV